MRAPHRWRNRRVAVGLLLEACLSLCGTTIPCSPCRAQAGDHATLRLHSQFITAWRADGLQVDDVDAVFAHVFSRLPRHLDVLPTENYFYWQLDVDGRELRGNFRLAPGERERGRLHFAYSEWDEFPAGEEGIRFDRLRRDKVFPVLEAGGDRFTWTARVGSKRVTFHLHRLEQSPPRLFPLAPNERFVQRTFDESGLGFFLLFDEHARQFRWVLNEEMPLPEHWRQLAPGLYQGRRTGFVFEAARGRKQLVAVRGQCVDRNDYCDGPFDQLADNFARQTRLREFLEKSNPQLRGRIDDFGNFTDDRAPARVAIAPYATYYTTAEAVRAARL
jgi:hypothetical protein